MGLLLEALKRLESDLPLAPAAPRDDAADAASVECEAVEESPQSEAEPYAAVSEEIDSLNQLLEEELPCGEQAALEQNDVRGTPDSLPQDRVRASTHPTETIEKELAPHADGELDGLFENVEPPGEAGFVSEIPQDRVRASTHPTETIEKELAPHADGELDGLFENVEPPGEAGFASEIPQDRVRASTHPTETIETELATRPAEDLHGVRASTHPTETIEKELAPHADGELDGLFENVEPPGEAGFFSEMARNILAQLSGVGPAVLFFTSPTDGEGKTETIPPLAEALVKASGQRTIMVDANLHRPHLTREWQFSSRRGIFDVLTGEADWWEAVQETGFPKLSILLNNGLPPEHAIVMQPLAFSELMENLKREYQLVLIDAASLAHAESIPMLRHCQGVYLIVRLGRSSPRAVREATQIIAQAGGNCLGCIAVGDVSALKQEI